MAIEFKAGDVVSSSISSHVYVVDTKKYELKILFNDGSCGWHRIWDTEDWRYSFSMKWTPQYLRERATMGFDKRWIDNLTYIELLDRANQNERTKS